VTVGARGCGLTTDCKRFAHTPSNFRCHKRLRNTSIVFDAGPIKLTNEKDVTLRWSLSACGLQRGMCPNLDKEHEPWKYAKVKWFWQDKDHFRWNLGCCKQID